MKNQSGRVLAHILHSSFCILHLDVPPKPGRVLPDGHQAQLFPRRPLNRKEKHEK